MWLHSANRTTYLLEIFHYSKMTFRIIYQKIDGPNFDFAEKHTYIFIWFLKNTIVWNLFFPQALFYALGIIFCTLRLIEFHRVL